MAIRRSPPRPVRRVSRRSVVLASNRLSLVRDPPFPPVRSSEAVLSGSYGDSLLRALSRVEFSSEQLADRLRESPSTPQATQNRNSKLPLTSDRLHIESQRPVSASGNALAKLRLVRGKNLHAPAAARNGHIPLLRIGSGLHRGVGKDHMIESFALRAVGSHRIAVNELTITSWENASVGESNVPTGVNA